MDVSNFLDSHPWAILPTVGEKLLAVQSPALEGNARASDAVSAFWTEQTSSPFALLPIRGIILPYTGAWASLWGGTCLDQLTDDFCKARDNPDVQTIVLAIDSPGGMITGVHAFSQLVFATRNIKPIMAVVSGLAASAAYWIAAAASQVWVDPTASVGSIGVMATYQDTAERDKKSGIQTLEIISSQSPYKRLDMTTESGRGQLQQHVDALAEVFVAAVAQYRSVPIDTVLSDFGQGGLVVGKAAVAQGLADQVHTFSDLSHHFFQHLRGEQTMSMPSSKVPFDQFIESEAYQRHKAAIKALLVEEIDTQVFYDQGFAAGVAAGKTEERARIEAVEAQSLPGHEALIQSLKFDGQTTGHEAAVQILAAEKAKQHAWQVDVAADAPAPLPPVLAEEIRAASLSLAEQCQKEWESSPELQAEFIDAAVYRAYREAEASGLIKRTSREKTTC